MYQNPIRAAYYHHLYPFQAVYDWLRTAKGAVGDGGSREYAFRFDSNAMARFKEFSSAEEFQNAVKRECPAEIHLGGIYVRVFLKKKRGWFNLRN